MYSIGFVTVVSFLLALVLTPVVRDLFLKLGVVDVADGGRKLHVGRIPRVGGVAIVVAYVGAFGGLMLTELSGGGMVMGGMGLVWRVAPAAGLIFFVGLMDDLFGVRAWTKFAVQLAAGLIAFWAGVRLTGVGGVAMGEWWVSLPLTVFWLVLCTNAFNLIDGVDGLASGVGLFATVTAMAAGLIQGNFALVMATAGLAGALLGFLRYNFNPASIFLGDSGSYLVGFLLGCFGLIWSQKAATVLGMTAPLMALAIPLLDVGLSVVRRFLRGAPVFEADRGHIHHMLLRRGWTVRRSVMVLYGVSGVFAVLSLVGIWGEGRMGGVVLVLFAVVAWVGVQNLGYVELSTAGKMIRGRGFRKLLGAEMTLRALREGLERAGTEEAMWEVLRRGLGEMGFERVVWEWDGAAWEAGEGYEEMWWLTVPLGVRGHVEMGRRFEEGGVSVVAEPLARMLREVMGVRGRVGLVKRAGVGEIS